ncbi:hypothetical protein HY949_00385 [Candidatus Gottesmanbacteria bacterium]|nr:hypothetical protein [Candidatus Gottesmanbacteria bacterium]
MITYEDIESHRALDKLASKMTAEARRAKQERERADSDRADRVLSDIHEEEEAIRYAAGLSHEQADTLFDVRGYDLAVEILHFLAEHDGTPEEAVNELYKIAGDEAGRYVDMLTNAFKRRVRQFGPDPVGDLSREEFDHDFPRKKNHRPTKNEVIALYDSWKQLQEIQHDFDESIDATMHGVDSD